jgi:fructose/tagatose bisphosphate aldolase
MPKVTFARLMEDAERRGYAVGYFESWNMESLLAVADAADAARSPVILGFSGIALPRKDRVMP